MNQTFGNQTFRGALVGGAAGLAIGILGEFAVVLVLALFPTDVQISGFAVVWAVPLGVAVGAVAGWQEWFGSWRGRAAAAAIPGFLAGVVAAAIQWASV